MWQLQLLKPFLYLWAGLNFIDDVSVVMKIFRLVGASTFNRRGEENPESICNLCDDLMENILRGSEGVEAVPCSWICLRTKKCTSMCRKIQEVSQTSSNFPCVAAGYCDQDENASSPNEIDCKKGPLYSCEPKKFCRKKRRGLKYTCDLKPGVSRWIHMKKTATVYTAALASGLIYQKRCDEPDAGPYCIAKPSGTGQVADLLGVLLSLVYGGYHSVIAIETPGGDDDQQWLTFWVILFASICMEQAFARVLLSKFPLYYQTKLILIVWLIFFDGATIVYRRFRRLLSQYSPFVASMLYHRNRITAQNQLDAMIYIGGQLIIDQITVLEENLKHNYAKRNSFLMVSNSLQTEDLWQYDYTEHAKTGIVRTTLDAEETLFHISKWILSSKGMQEMEDKLNNDSVALLLERAAPVISFQPKFLHINLIGTKSGDEGRLPAMDENGTADCYVKFSLVCAKKKEINKNSLTNESVTSSIAYRTLEPKWNEMLGMPINGGVLDSDGKYRNNESRYKILLVEAWDADCGKWGISLEIFQFLVFVLIFALIFAYVMGAIDFFFNTELTREQWQWKMTIMALTLYVILGLVLSYMMSVVWRADDEFIGSSTVPLGILADQREHALLLMLQDHSKDENNAVKGTYGCGVLRMMLVLSG